MRHAVGERAQHFVSDRVPERVVDVLHRVDVDEDDADALVVASGVPERDANAIVEHRALRQTGEVVTAEVLRGHGSCVRFDLTAVRDEPGDLAERSDLGHDRQPHREQVARRGEDRNIAVPRTMTQQRRADLVVVTRENLRREQVGSRETFDVAHAEALARRLVQVPNLTMFVNDADKIRGLLDVPEQLCLDVGAQLVRHPAYPTLPRPQRSGVWRV